MNPYAAFGIALAGNALLSFGMALQKKNIAFVGRKAARDAAWKRARVGWIAGFTLMNVVPVFNFAALLGLPANVVAAVSGSNVAFTAIFSALLLGEVLPRRSIVVTTLMFAAIAAAGLRGVAGSGSPATLPVLVFLALPLLLAVPALALRRRRGGPALAVLFAGVAGSLGGFMILPLKILGALPEPSLALWLSSPWLWLYLVAGASSFGLLQLAYKDGAMNRVGPGYYGLYLLWPAIASWFVFSLPFDPIQAAALAVIAVCVVLIAGAGER